MWMSSWNSNLIKIPLLEKEETEQVTEAASILVLMSALWIWINAAFMYSWDGPTFPSQEVIL